MTEGTKKRFLTGAGSARAAHVFAETFPKIPALVIDYKRCGKACCRCEAGRLHGPYHYLRWREGTVQRRCYVRAADVPAVLAILDRRQDERRRERLEHALGLMTWRQMARQVEAYEERLRERLEHR
jgi:hypothetical protein